VIAADFIRVVRTVRFMITSPAHVNTLRIGTLKQTHRTWQW